MIVAAHQPHYLPWLGYLDKLANCDLFVVMDDLQYERGNFQNRQRIKTNLGGQWITVPVERGSLTDRIVDKRIDNSGRGGRHHWQARTLRALEVHYARTPQWGSYAAALDDIYTRRWDWLVDLDLYMLDLARRWFGIGRPIVRSSSLGLMPLHKTARIVDLCERVGASCYLSGGGGSTSYLDEAAFARAGIAVRWQAYRHPHYPQRYPARGFVSHLAFLDYVLNCGTALPAAATRSAS